MTMKNQEVVSNPRVMISVQEIRSKDEYLYMHSINVCVLSLLIAKKKGYNQEAIPKAYHEGRATTAQGRKKSATNQETQYQNPKLD